jgi:hypothetical protein
MGSGTDTNQRPLRNGDTPEPGDGAGHDWHGIGVGDAVVWIYPGRAEMGPAIVLTLDEPWVPDKLTGLTCDLSVRMVSDRTRYKVPSSICRIVRTSSAGPSPDRPSIRSDRRPRR